MNQKAAAVWDRRAESWDAVCHSAAFLSFRDEVLARADLSPHDVLLDLGCGTGLIALGAYGRCQTVIALDHSREMLNSLRQSGQSEQDGLRTVHADMRSIPLADCSVDAVVSCYAFHHLSDDGKELALAEARRVLRPDGRLVIADMMFRLSLETRDRRILAGKIVAVLAKGPGGVLRLTKNAGRIIVGRWEKPATIDWWAAALVRRGFDDIEVRPLRHEAGLAFARRPASR